MILMGMVKHSQSSKIASLQCLYNISKKEGRDKVVLLPADKHQRFLQCGTIITDGHDHAFSK